MRKRAMTHLRTLQQFTLENRRKTVNSSAIRSVKTSHVSTGAYSASDAETPQQKNRIPLCRSCAGPKFFVERLGKQGEINHKKRHGRSRAFENQR
jgi:hypothetical protein